MSETTVLAELSSTAIAVARAQASEVPTYAPSHYALAMGRWQQAQQAVMKADISKVYELLKEVSQALEVATYVADKSRELLSDLVRLRASSLRHDGQRYHGAKALVQADASYWDAVAAAEKGDPEAAQRHALDARDGYLQARREFLERGVLDHLDRSLADAPLLTTAERDFLQGEIARLRDGVADIPPGDVLQISAAIRRRIGTGPGIPGEGQQFELDPSPWDDWAPPPDAVTYLLITGRGVLASGSTLTLRWRWSEGSELNVLFRQREGGPFERVTTFEGPTEGLMVEYTDEGLDPDVTYCYSVRAENRAGARSTPAEFRPCGHTLDPSRLGTWRIQLRIRTADVPDAGSDDSVQVRLNSPLPTHVPRANSTWLDYGPRPNPLAPSPLWSTWPDDFARGRDFTYDLVLDHVHDVSDITMLTLHKEGSDAVGIAELSLRVNDAEVFARRFGESSQTCLWLDEGDGYSPTYTIYYPELRAHPAWQAFILNPLPPFTTDDGDIVFVMTNADIVSRIEGIVGNSLHGTPAYWGMFYGPGWVEAVRLDDQRLRVDLDLAAEVFGRNPEIDIDFDLRFEVICGQPQAGNTTIKLTTENFDAVANVPDLEGVFVDALQLFGEVRWIEDEIEGRIEEAFQPITESLALNTGGICPTLRVTENGDIELRAPLPNS